MTGKELQKLIIEDARSLGWRVAHFPVVQTTWGTWQTQVAADGKGFPDLILVRDRIIAAEVKGKGDSLKPEQKVWRSAFILAGVPHYVWNTRSWEGGDVARILRARSAEAYDFAAAFHAR